MTRSVHRRFLLTGLGHAAAMASLSSILPRQAAAGQQAAAAPLKVCMQMIYPAGEGLTFDADAFRDRHIALLKNSYGPAVERIELRVSPPPPPPPPAVEGQPAPPAPQGAPIMASVSMWLGDIGEFVKRLRAAVRRGDPMMVNGELVGPERLGALLKTGKLPEREREGVGRPERELGLVETLAAKHPVRVE